MCLILWFKGCTGIHGCVSTCLLFLCLFTFWTSQSRLQLLLFLVEIFKLILFDFRSIFKAQQSVQFATLSWCLQLFWIFYLQLNSPSSTTQKPPEADRLPVCSLLICQQWSVPILIVSLYEVIYQNLNYFLIYKPHKTKKVSSDPVLINCVHLNYEYAGSLNLSLSTLVLGLRKVLSHRWAFLPNTRVKIKEYRFQLENNACVTFFVCCSSVLTHLFPCNISSHKWL